MSRYQWPRTRKSGTDRPMQRMRYNALTDGVLPAESVSAARSVRALVERAAPAAAPGGNDNLWVPIGPSTVIKGQATGHPRVAGRVRDICVSPDGMRAYAGSANGGVWFTSDAGNTWSPLGNWLITPGASNLVRGATSLTCGCLLVNFGATAADDEVYAGTGELTRTWIQATPGSKLAGVGILRLKDPVPTVIADPFGQHWQREGKNIASRGIFRLARHPSNANQIVAATSVGLFHRDGAFVEDSDWTRVSIKPFNFSETGDKYITDVLWVATTPKPRLFVALVDTSNSSKQTAQLWFSDDGPEGTYNQIDLPNPYVGDAQRLAFAVAPSDPTMVYVLGSGPRLYQVVGGTAKEVRNLPSKLFIPDKADQSYYDMAIAVHPDHSDTLAIGGSAFNGEAAMYEFVVRSSAGLLTTDFDTNPNRDLTLNGQGVHADVHQIRYVKVGSNIHVWATCDGGVFRSTAGGTRYTFVARNTGLAVLEPGYVASHSQNDAFVVAGSQDNGLLQRVGDSLWIHWPFIGDGGGVAFHPIKNRFFVAESYQANWSSNGTISAPVSRRTGGASEASEQGNSSFYSTCDVRQISPSQASLAIGTNRVWLADNWDPQANTTSWVTIPSGQDPRAGTGSNESTDTYGKGKGRIICCRWIDNNRLMALMHTDYSNYGTDCAVLFYKRNGAKWDAIDDFSSKSNKKSFFGNSDIDQPTSSYLPPLGAWSDLAVHNPLTGTRGSVYVAATGDGTSDRMDTLWWYNGSDTWYPTGLRNSPTGTKAPAYAVAVDPSDSSAVYVGTALGVWRGILNFGPQPNWKWEPFSNGLPEAAVQDVSVFYNVQTKLLRAAIQARGIWEVDISSSPTPVQRTFLRVHPNDARRSPSTSLDNPMSDGPVKWRWYASPDIRTRPAQLKGAETPPPFPPVSLSAYDRWVFQTALHATDPLCRPTGQEDELFQARLRVNDPIKGTTIDQARWQAIVTAANVFATPWDGPEPTEADLFELIVEDGVDPESSSGMSTPPFYDWPAPPPVASIRPRMYKIDVLVHNRDVRPLAANQVRVALLALKLPSNFAQWGAISLSTAWKDSVTQLMTGSATVLPDGWELIDSTKNLTSDIDARTPRVVTFDINFSTLNPAQYQLLLAVVYSTPDQVNRVTLSGDNIQDLVLTCHQVAARVVQR